ncbi:aminoglycoside phosphotransferase family protein [Sphingopyxis sp. LK2115]|jgi:aminoglycoside/choline kinase family phosphotransferase|uniref:aminoglycoside phosphotransferase family protein n=1 Tax=Sphingopyxis sp. LK2115 TaxID=2744558 RepID=UPI001CB73EB0|nr:phosphotransferase [Sphingopyxis sp. LK2115]
MAASMIPPAHAPAFLAAHGWGNARILPLAGDASFRRYFRVVDGERRAVLMDAPPPHEDPRPFIAVAEYLCAAGLNAPTILARDLDAGLLLIEDFGDVRLRETVDAALDRETAYYAGVTDLLIHLHTRPPMPGLPVHGLEQWLDEVMLFADWYCPALDIEVDRDGFRAAWQTALMPVETDGLPRVTVLRDFHAENIMLVAGQDGLARYGLLDFQDALVGHPAYDLASVLEDARRDVDPAVEAAMLARYQAATGRDIEQAYWALAAQRNTRILGVFVRLWKRDGKPHYRQFQPRMWGLLERDFAHPALAAVRQWFDAHIPAAKRAEAWT